MSGYFFRADVQQRGRQREPDGDHKRVGVAAMKSFFDVFCAVVVLTLLGMPPALAQQRHASANTVQGTAEYFSAKGTVLSARTRTVTKANLQPVTIQGKHFYTAGALYFPLANFLSSGAGFTHAYLSPQISDAQRLQMLNAALSQGHNAMFLYTIHEREAL